MSDDVLALAKAAAGVIAELDVVRSDGTAAHPTDIVRRYGIVAAARSCLRMEENSTALPGWTSTASTRLLGRLGVHSGVLPPELADEMFAELARRVSERRSPGIRTEPIFQ